MRARAPARSNAAAPLFATTALSTGALCGLALAAGLALGPMPAFADCASGDGSGGTQLTATSCNATATGGFATAVGANANAFGILATATGDSSLRDDHPAAKPGRERARHP